MKILIVEDSKNRIRKFYNLLGHHKIIAINYAEGAIELIKSQNFDLIFLDYDLRESENKTDVFTNYWIHNINETFYEKQGFKAPKVVVHSFNVAGAKKMIEQLTSSEIECHKIEFFDIVRNNIAVLSKKLKISL